MNIVKIVTTLLELKLRNYYKNISRIFGIYLNNKIYFAFKILKIILVFASLNLLFDLYYKESYANYIIVLYTVFMILINIGFMETTTRGVLRPRNIELYQISGIDSKKISLLFIFVEYIWKKFMEADLIIPFFLMAVKIGGSSAILYTLCMESILLLILIYRIYIHKNVRQERINNVSIVNFAGYVVICGIIIKVTAFVVTKILEMSKMARGSLNSFTEFNKETMNILETRFTQYLTDVINKIESILDAYILDGLDWRIMASVILMSLALSYRIINKCSVNYGRVIYELTPNGGCVKEKYLELIMRLSKGVKNRFLIEKDLNILRHKISFLNKSIFSTVFLPYDFFVIATFMYCLRQNTVNDYLIVICVIFGMVSILFNQVNTISSTFSSVFRFEPDMKNAELYRISEYSIKDVLEAKICLCRMMCFIPYIITGVVSACLLLGVGNTFVQNFLYIAVMLVVSVIVYLYAPNMKLYIYNYLMEKEQITDEEKMEEKIDEMTQRFCEIPRNILILPMMYVLLINSIFRLVKGSQWQMVLYLYLAWLAIMFFLELLFIRKMLERSGPGNNEQIS